MPSVTPAQISGAAAKAHVAATLLRALVQQESGGSTTARSPAGAIGPTQLMPATAAGLHVDPYNPEQNLLGGARYLRQQLDTFHTPALALAAYNAGPGAVQKYGGIPPFRETQNYVKTVLANAERYGSTDTPAAPAPVAPAAVRPLRLAPTAPPRTFARPDALVATLLAGKPIGGLLRNRFAPSAAFAASSPAATVDTLTSELLAGKPIGKLLGRRAAPPALPPPPGAAPGSLPVAQPRNIGQPATVKVDARQAGPVPAVGVKLVDTARKWLGTPYSWGGGSPAGPTFGTGRGAGTKGFDCSGFAQYVAASVGKQIPRTTYQQWKALPPVIQPGPGDLVFFEPSKQGPGHVGMYIGNGQFIESPHTGATIRISRLADRSDYVGARSFLAA